MNILLTLILILILNYGIFKKRFSIYFGEIYEFGKRFKSLPVG